MSTSSDSTTTMEDDVPLGWVRRVFQVYPKDGLHYFGGTISTRIRTTFFTGKRTRHPRGFHGKVQRSLRDIFAVSIRQTKGSHAVQLGQPLSRTSAATQFKLGRHAVRPIRGRNYSRQPIGWSLAHSKLARRILGISPKYSM